MDAREIEIRKTLKQVFRLAKSNDSLLAALKRLIKGERQVVQKPCGFDSWDACVAEQKKEYDADTAEKVCGKIFQAAKKSTKPICVTELISKMLDEGEVLKYRNGSLITKQSIGEQGGSIMGRIATPMGVLMLIKRRVDRVVAQKKRPLTEREVDALVKQTVGEIPPGWEGYTIPGYKQGQADAKKFLTAMGYDSGSGEKVGDLGHTKDGGDIDGASPKAPGGTTETDVPGIGVATTGEQLTKKTFGQRLLKLSHRLQREGLKKQDELPPLDDEAPLETFPETVEEHSLGLEERVSALESAALTIAEEVARLASATEATATQEAEVGAEVAEGVVAAQEQIGGTSTMSPVAARAKRKREVGKNLRVRPKSAIAKGEAIAKGDKKGWTTIVGLQNM